MPTNRFDQFYEPDGLPDDQDYWPDSPAWDEEFPDWQENRDANPAYAYEFNDYETGDNFPGDYESTGYESGDYQSGDLSLPLLPKVLILCTIVACLLLVGVLSLVSVELNFTESQTAGEMNAGSSQTSGDSQSQTGLAAQTSPNDAFCSVSERFPASIRRWCGLITQYAAKHGLPPNLVAALIWQESGGNPVAYSHSGAVGLDADHALRRTGSQFPVRQRTLFFLPSEHGPAARPRVQRFLWHPHAGRAGRQDRQSARSFEVVWTDERRLLLRR